MPDPAPSSDTIDRLRRALGGAYEVRRLRGRGGFAEVYEVWDRELERRLAVKVLRPDIAWTSGMLRRFKDETRAIARLQHPHILPIHFVAEGEGLVYYAMPFVQGQSLGDLLRGSGALPPDRALAIAVPVLQALAHAHAQGLIHRDIKPENVMIEEASGRPVLVDFGIAKRLDAEGGLTQTGFVVGTPHYMSPEQALGQRDVDARSDLYAMGAVLYQMLTGEPPFDGDSSQEIVGKHIAQPPPAAAEVNGKVPRWVSNVVTRSLQKKPGDRFQSAAMMLDALQSGPATPAVDAQTELVESAERERKTRPTAQPLNRPTALRRRWPFVVVPLVIVAVAAFVLVSRPRLQFENRLLHPVRLTTAEREWVVEPGARIDTPLPRGRSFVAAWSLVRPTNQLGEPLGVDLSGTVNLERPRGRVRVATAANAAQGAFFAPLLSNNTGRPLTVVVNAGLQGGLPCRCVVPPGSIRMPIGYYPLFRNSTVRARDRQGRTATFTDLGPEVDRRSGEVRLRFEAADLR